MTAKHQYPDRAWGFALSAGEAPVMLNGMRVEFSERVALYPVDLDQVSTPSPSASDA